MNSPSHVRVSDVAFVRFAAPDLDQMEDFLVEFGMVRSERTHDTLYMRGSDDEGFIHVTHLADKADFIGLAFLAQSVDDLDALSALDHFTQPAELEGPGGGRVVSTLDPNGFRVEVVADRGSIGRLPVERQVATNNGASADRLGSPIRIKPGPSQVKRLGHLVLDVIDFRSSEAWYKEHFGLVTSDEIAKKDGNALGAFLRCDAGKRYVDHHTLFMINAGHAGFNHAAFEVASFDDLMAGHTHLSERGRKHQWGIGRHVLGSQIFDYWYDPYGRVLEHWTDGDLFNDETEPNIAPISQLLASQWGPTNSAPER
jgi:catechol 2,3-dioxygenase-like lactoylglutathione lyase family enzyme